MGISCGMQQSQQPSLPSKKHWLLQHSYPTRNHSHLCALCLMHQTEQLGLCCNNRLEASGSHSPTSPKSPAQPRNDIARSTGNSWQCILFNQAFPASVTFHVITDHKALIFAPGTSSDKYTPREILYIPIAGNFRGVQNFTFFVDRCRPAKIKTTKSFCNAHAYGHM